MKITFPFSVLFVTYFFAASITAAQSNLTSGETMAFPRYGPYAGNTGYQEIKLNDQDWYVAYHGNRQTPNDWLNAAWAIRAAQLCAIQGTSFYVEMQYVTEPLSRDEKLGSRGGDESLPTMRKVASFQMPIIIFTPTPVSVRAYTLGEESYTPIIIPSKLAPIRCVKQPFALLDASRAVNIQTSIENGKKFGIKIQ